MPHQDMDDLRTPLAELKELFRPLEDCSLESVRRHGNASLDLVGIAVMAVLTFGWNQRHTLGERFSDAQQATKRRFASASLAASYQALMVALRACGDQLCELISRHLVSHLQSTTDWLFLGRPTFAVDGSQFAVPRTQQNLAAFAAAGRKSKAAYRKNADYAKAKTTQVAVSLCLHLTSGLPLFWKTGGSSESERELLPDMLERLPENSRLVTPTILVLGFGTN